MASDSATTILIVDDDEEIRYSLGRVLGSRDYWIETASSGEEGIERIRSGLAPDLVMMDIRMGGISGIETLQHMRSISPNLLVVLMTAFGTAQTAIEAMKFGAYDYVMKPFDVDKVIGIVSKAIRSTRDLKRSGTRDSKLNYEDYKEGIVGNAPAMQEVFKVIGQVAASDATVLLTGASGTGKELIAKCIYGHSLRSEGAFLAINCAAIPENLIESELFGHEKGAFTGATSRRVGKFEQCDRGTVFLDEIGDMPLATQTKILRVLQEGEIQRVGGSETLKVDVRIIGATNKDLDAMVRDGAFREDLFYRLNVFRIRVPLLSERREDIPDIVDFMLQDLVREKKARATRISADALALLLAYSWPGNVRELGNVIYHGAVVAQGDVILAKDLPDSICGEDGVEFEAALPERLSAQSPVTAETSMEALSMPSLYDSLFGELRERYGKRILDVIEKEMIQRAVADTGGNQARAAEILGITRNTLKKRLDEYALMRES